MAIKGIGHLAFDVTDMDGMMNFYCGILGLQRAFGIKDDDGNPWIEYVKVKDGQFIEMFYGGKKIRDREPKEAGYSHLCLEVDDIHEIAERLEGKGIALDVRPVKGKDGNYQCWVRDPDGNRIEFMQMSPDSPQMKN